MSALRRGDSVSCLLRPKHSFSDDDLQRRRDVPSATVLTSTDLPAYCTDRLYLLSELDVNAHSIHFLCDVGVDNGSDVASPVFPPSVLLYLRWEPAAHPTPHSFVEGPLRDCVRRCLRANGDAPPAPPSASGSPDGSERESEREAQLTNIYVVVDRLPSLDANHVGDKSASQNQLPAREEKQWRRALHLDAEGLARAVAASPSLRTCIDGLSVGVTSNDRAAPGLEACMEAVSRGAKERRRAARSLPAQHREELRESAAGGSGADNEGTRMAKRRVQALGRLRTRSPERSPLAFLAPQIQDLHHESMDHHDHAHHHHEGEGNLNAAILQCRVSSEWNGKGDYHTFADRAMGEWRQAWCSADAAGEGSTARGKINRGVRRRPKVPRISARGQDTVGEGYEGAEEPLSKAMVAVFLAVLVAYALYQWQTYGDLILSLIGGTLGEW